jgi:hypothetical protein
MKSTVSRLRHLGAILFAAILVASGTAISDQPAEAAGPGAGWNYQRTITLSAATPSASFQTRVQLTDLSNMAANGNDLRFYDSSHVQADYWIEYWNTNPVGQATVWVEVPTAGTTSLTMYYGNAGATAASSGDSTFIAFDDFSGTSINAAKWDAKDADASITVSGGSVSLTSGPGAQQGDQIIHKTSFAVSSGVIVEGVTSSDVICRCAGRTSLSGASTLSGTGAYFSADWPASQSRYAVWSAGRNGVIGYAAFHDGDGVGGAAPVYVVSVGTADGYVWPVNGYVFGVAFEAGRVEYFQNYTSSGSSTTNALSGSTAMYPVLANFWEGTCGGTSSFGINTFRVRKFLAGYNPTVAVGAATVVLVGGRAAGMVEAAGRRDRAVAARSDWRTPLLVLALAATAAAVGAMALPGRRDGDDAPGR